MAPNRAARKLRDFEDSTELSDLEQFVGYNLKRAYVIFQNDFREVLGQDGLSTRSFSALSLVVQFPDITQSELARRLGIERSGLVAIVDELEKRQFLQRTTVPGDRRVQALVPTEAGQGAYDAALKKVQFHEEKILNRLEPQEIKTLVTLLQKLREQD